MKLLRREFLMHSGVGLAAMVATSPLQRFSLAQTLNTRHPAQPLTFDVRQYGCKGNGITIDSAAINAAIEAASAKGGGTVYFPAGTYLCYSIRLKSNIVLHLDPGASIVAASVPVNGTTQGFDPAEPNTPWDTFQDYGHSHWHNSLIWGEGLHNVAIIGTGLIWGKGLSRGASEAPLAETAGMGNKAIALKHCRDVLLRDFSILEGGHFAVLATGVDNLTIENVLVDTNRDGIDVDCCRNVRITDCSINSPWDDAICPKSSFALGYARPTENVTIANCYVTGAYEVGSMLDGTWRHWTSDPAKQAKILPYFPKEFNGSIKLGTESNGGFKNIAITNCVFEGSKGLAIESSDGAIVEDITVSGLTMRGCTNTPIFLRLGARMRGPKDAVPGGMKRIVLSDIVSSGSVSRLGGGGIISGIPGHSIEDLKIHDVFCQHVGGGTAAMAALNPEESAEDDPYPDPDQFGDMPASGFFLRHIDNLEMTNIEIAFPQPESRPVFWLSHVKGADLFRIKTPKTFSGPVFALKHVEEFQVSACRHVTDVQLQSVDQKQL